MLPDRKDDNRQQYVQGLHNNNTTYVTYLKSLSKNTLHVCGWRAWIICGRGTLAPLSMHSVNFR
jgi:hypothetical protein